MLLTLQTATTVPPVAPFGTMKATSCESEAHSDDWESFVTLSAAHLSRDDYAITSDITSMHFSTLEIASLSTTTRKFFESRPMSSNLDHCTALLLAPDEHYVG